MNSLESTMTQKGQVTIPAAIRVRLGLKPRDRVRFEIAGDVVTIKPAESRLLAGFGAVRPRNRPEDWQAIEEEFERLVAADAAAEG
ncbi:MAG: AbrB/MazE/SpoVT family DNA-binding domain-containing protein [Thermomicrobiales bacterium]